MNESTLEARVDQVLQSIFPTFRAAKVQHQTSFTLKFGHHDILVDNKEPGRFNRAVADVLVTIDDRPVILLELKADGHVITEDDVQQGLSYGRLVEKIPPITAVTNSKDTRLYNTFTREKLDVSEVNAEQIQKILDQGFRVAGADLRNAIELLLGKDLLLFAQVAERITLQHMSHQLGEVWDILTPISPGFQIPRTLVDEIFRQNELGKSVLAVRGGAFSGKTNVLYQVGQGCQKRPGHYFLYWNCRDASYGVLQKLANEFSKILSYHVTKEKVREWLLRSGQMNLDARILVCFDNLNFEAEGNIVEEVLELISLLEGTSNTLVYTVDDYNYQHIAYEPDRPYKTALGSRGILLDLEDLDDGEYECAWTILRHSFGTVISRGGAHSRVYHQPRVLRQLVAELMRLRRDPESTAVIKAVPDESILNLLGNSELFIPNSVKQYRNLCLALIDDLSAPGRPPELSLIASGTGMVRLDIYEKRFETDYKELAQSGLVAQRSYVGIDLVLPRVPELLAYSAVVVILERIYAHDSSNIKNLTDHFLRLCSIFPYSDVLGSLVIRAIGDRNDWGLFSKIVNELMRRSSESMPATGSKVMLFLEEVGPVTIKIPEGVTAGTMYDDPLAYVILSHLCKTPMGLVEPGDNHDLAFWHTLLYTLTSTEGPLFRVENGQLLSGKGMQTWDLEGVGSFIDPGEGVVEPIVQSLSQILLNSPQTVELLYERAVNEGNLEAMWRIYLANHAVRPLLEGLGNGWPEWLDIRFDADFSPLVDERLLAAAETAGEGRSLEQNPDGPSAPDSGKDGQPPEGKDE